ncbi:MAG: NAD(P)-binding domain-containing protein, partial [Bacteroides sp.]
MKVTIIGAGNMGGSIARGLSKSKLFADDNIVVSDPNEGILENLGSVCPNLITTRNNQEAASGAEIVILAVKPWLVQTVLRELKLKSKQILVSIA